MVVPAPEAWAPIPAPIASPPTAGLPAPNPVHPEPNAPTTRLSAFTLRHGSALPRQTREEHANPLCRLLAETHGGSVCGAGCGVGGPAAEAPGVHVCPFGMAMRRLDTGGGAAEESQWLGRRFLSAESMHGALDHLTEAGFDPEQVIDRLPPNPVVSEDELALEASTWPERPTAAVIPMVEERLAAAMPAPLAAPPVAEERPEPAPSASAAPAAPPVDPKTDRLHVSAITEYMMQIHSLLATAETPDEICQRFVQAVSVAFPGTAMTICLGRPGEAPTATAEVNWEELCAEDLELARERRRRVGGRWPGAAERRRRWVCRTARTNGSPSRSAALSMSPLGVWMLRPTRGEDAHASGMDRLDLLQLLGQFLAARLRPFAEATPPNEASPAKKKSATAGSAAPARAGAQDSAAESWWWDAEAARTAAEAEVARAIRHEMPLSMLRIQCTAEGRDVKLPVRELTGYLVAAVRPYDRLGARRDEPGCWELLLPHAGEEAACEVALRLMMLIEDEMDARGGLEERGMRLSVGVSTLGLDAQDAEGLAAHAAKAARQATRGKQPDASIGTSAASP